MSYEIFGTAQATWTTNSTLHPCSKYAHSVLIIYSLQRHDILCTYFLVAMVGISLSGGICSPAFEQKITNFDFLRSGHN